MTTYSNTFSGSNSGGNWAGTLSLNIGIDALGNVVGTGAVTVSFTETQYPGSFPNFSGSNTANISGWITQPLPQYEVIEYSYMSWGPWGFEGNFNSTQSAITGTVDFDYAPTNNYWSAPLTLYGQPSLPPVISFSSGSLRVGANAGLVTFTLSRGPVPLGDLGSSVYISTKDGVAIAGKDYGAINNMHIIFAAGQSTATFTDTVIYNSADAAAHINPDFSIVLSNPINASIGFATADVTIVETTTITAAADNQATTVNAGHVVTITVTTPSSETVTGTPSLQLNDNEVASYTGGSGTNTLTFTYVVQPSDNVSDLKVTGLNLPSGATIHDQAGNALSGSVTADLGIQIATTASTPATVTQELASLYVTLYGLAATQAGITYWINSVSAHDPSITAANAGSTAISGADEVYLGQQMTAGSPVVNGTTYFQTVYPTTMTDLAYVQALYQNMSGFIGTTAGDQYWLAVLQQSEAANGGNVTLAREAIVGQFTHDFYGNNLTVGAAALGVSTSDYALLVAGQQTLRNKATVAQYWATETGVSGGAILNFASVTDPSFAAAQHVLAGITSDPNTVTVAITGIAAAVAQQNLSLV